MAPADATFVSYRRPAARHSRAQRRLRDSRIGEFKDR